MSTWTGSKVGNWQARERRQLHRELRRQRMDREVRERAERDAVLRYLRHAGLSYSELGLVYGLTDARVWQIVKAGTTRGNTDA